MPKKQAFKVVVTRQVTQTMTVYVRVGESESPAIITVQGLQKAHRLTQKDPWKTALISEPEVASYDKTTDGSYGCLDLSIWSEAR